MDTVHKKDKQNRWTSLRRCFSRLNGRAVARYAFLTMAGILLYGVGAAYALRQRGYFAIGGEALFLLLPAFYYAAAKTIGDIARDARSWRER